MSGFKAIKTLLFLGALLFGGPNAFAQQSGKVLDQENTILGEISVIEIEETKREIRLNHKVILRIDEQAEFSSFEKWLNRLAPISIADIVRKRIAPFDEVVIFNNGFGTFHCGPGLVFLGLSKNGQYKFSRPTSSCSMPPDIQVLTDSIVVTSEPEVHSGRCDYLPIPGGKWVYKQGQLQRVKYVLLPDPVKNREKC